MSELSRAERRRIKQAIEKMTVTCSECGCPHIVCWMVHPLGPQIRALTGRQDRRVLRVPGAPHHSWCCPRCKVRLTWVGLSAQDALWLEVNEVVLLGGEIEQVLEFVTGLEREEVDPIFHDGEPTT